MDNYYQTIERLSFNPHRIKTREYLLIILLNGYTISNLFYRPTPMNLIEYTLIMLVFDFFMAHIIVINNKMNRVINHSDRTKITFLDAIPDIDKVFNQRTTLSKLLALFPGKARYIAWGIIETNDAYQIVFIELRKKNAVLITSINKNQLTQFHNQERILKIMNLKVRGTDKQNKPVMKYILPTAHFYEKF